MQKDTAGFLNPSREADGSGGRAERDYKPTVSARVPALPSRSLTPACSYRDTDTVLRDRVSSWTNSSRLLTPALTMTGHKAVV